MIKKFIFLLFAGLILCNCAFASDCEIIHKSIKYYKNKVYSDDKNVCQYYNLAEEYLRKNKIQDALYLYKKVTEIDKQEEIAYVKRADLYFKFMNENKANMEWARLVKNMPDSQVGNEQLAMIYYNILDYDNALKHINKAIEIDKEQDSMLFNIRGKILQDAGSYEEAIEDYTRFLDRKQYINIKYFGLYYAITYDERGECYKAIGKTKEADADKQKYSEYLNNNKIKHSVFGRIEDKHNTFKRRIYTKELY